MVKQSPKMTALVVSAIRNLREVQGSTPKEILNYIMSEYNASSSANAAAIQRKLCTVLKRGVDYGILKHSHGHYCLNTDPETVAPMDDMIGPMERGGHGCNVSMRRKRRRRRASSRRGCKPRSSRRGRKRRSGGSRKRRKGRRSRRSTGRRGRRKSRGRSRRGRSGKSRRSGRSGRSGRRRGHRRSGRKSHRSKSQCRQRRTGEDIDMLAKDPIDNRHRENPVGEYTYDGERERSRSRGRQSRSRTRSPSHSRSSGSSDREATEGNRRDRQEE